MFRDMGRKASPLMLRSKDGSSVMMHPRRGIRITGPLAELVMALAAESGVSPETYVRETLLGEARGDWWRQEDR
jgi:hypothetical protein